MASVTTVRDVLYHYTFARGLYERLIGKNCHPQVARNIVALLLWFGEGTNKIISHVSSMTDTALGLLLSEASWIIHWLHTTNFPSPPTPLLSALCQDSHTDLPSFVALNKGNIAHGVAGLLDGVCTVIFDDRLYHLLRRYQTGLVGHNQELEAPYESVVATVPEDCRSMFITFSKGQPVEREEIFNYIRGIWGDCIVRILMEKTTGRAQPMYGRAIFKSKGFVSLMLHGEQHVPLFIGAREIWLREYVPRDSASSSNGTSVSAP